MFVRAIADGLRGLDGVLSGLATMAHHPVDSPTVVTPAGGLVPAWEPMIEALVKMLGGAAGGVFGRIVPCFVPLRSPAPTGDHRCAEPERLHRPLLWGVGERGRGIPFLRPDDLQQLPARIQLAAKVLERTGGSL